MSNLKNEGTLYAHAPKNLVAVDCIIFGFDMTEIKVLLFKRLIEPLKDRWSLVGSFVDDKQTIEQTARDVLHNYTGLHDIYLNQLKTYSDPSRDPGGRVISTALYALIKLDVTKLHITYQYQASWFSISDLPELILDHHTMVNDAMHELRELAKRQPIGFELLPKNFTIPQLQSVYEAIFQKELDGRNFRKKILSLNILKKLAQKDYTTSKKGAFLYRFDKKKYALLSQELNYEFSL